MSNTSESVTAAQITNFEAIGDQRHAPGEPLLSIDEHMIIASRLSRALYLALDGNCEHDLDHRDVYALKELASVVAHHSSAALHVYDNRCSA